MDACALAVAGAMDIARHQDAGFQQSHSAGVTHGADAPLLACGLLSGLYPQTDRAYRLSADDCERRRVGRLRLPPAHGHPDHHLCAADGCAGNVPLSPYELQ